MSQQKGRLLLIQLGDAASPEVFTNLCGIKTRSFNLSANEIDTTVPDCNNPGAAVQRTIELGIVNRTFSGSGKFVSGSNSGALMAHVRNATTFNAKVIVPGEGVYTGSWGVTEFEFSGEDEGNMDFSATFVAAGKLTFVPESGAPANVVPPAVAGVAQVGQALNALLGQWEGSATFTYQWKKGGSNITGATSATYTPVTGDIASGISVAVTATNASGSQTVTSGETANVIAA